MPPGSSQAGVEVGGFAVGVAGAGPPFGDRDHSRWYQEQAAEQGGDLGVAACVVMATGTVVL